MLIHGDCLQELKSLPDNSVGSIVTDPPYGLSFMGKKWDYDVPSVEVWKECLRVLKPGGHLLSFAGTRTYHRMACNIEDAGFEIRDQIMWLYGSGFPKSHNLKDEWQGWGTALKPANEPIVVARKPLEKGLTIAQNVLKYGTGALNIDESRIELGANEDVDKLNARSGGKRGFSSQYVAGNNDGDLSAGCDLSKGRWPANVLLDEESSAALDLQVGDNVSRFFYVAKASKRERGEGNNHPTVKPIKLMEYLIKLVTPANGTVLDPFAGSGTTLLAAVKNDFGFIGIEREAEYVAIAKARLESQSA